MNRNTCWQAWRYREEHVTCPGCHQLLERLVAEHNAATGRTHPGYRRLEATTGRSRDWIATHLRHLEDEGHIVLAKAAERLGQGRNKAAEYEIPWLQNPASKPASSLPVIGRKSGRKPGRIPGHSLSLREKGAAAATGEPAAPAGRTDSDGVFHPGICGCADCTNYRSAPGGRPSDLDVDTNTPTPTFPLHLEHIAKLDPRPQEAAR